MSELDKATSTGPEEVPKRKAFIPLECNPEVMTNLIHKLGVSDDLAFHDVYSIDDQDLLAFIPRPAYALLLVFPVTKLYEEFRIKEDEPLEEYSRSGDAEPVVWYKQTIKNACGMMGLLHGVSNGDARGFIKADSQLASLLKEALPLKPLDRAKLLETSAALESAYQTAAAQGSTEAPDAEADVDLHYICFVKSDKDQHLYELDGGRKGPLDRGLLEPADDVLSEKVLDVVRGFIKRENEAEGKNLNFSLVALAPSLE
ncbi:hypothetical protein DFH27DRAFT_263574 [Peziza echinospora]|nr:hypothetical protein DFH27DRAFT_263574 [Peziza echinospora]